jgi:hypothetical protein
VDLDYVAVDLAVGLAADVELFVGLDVVYLFAGLLLDNENEVREDEEDHVELFLLVDELNCELVEVLDGLMRIGGYGLLLHVLVVLNV